MSRDTTAAPARTATQLVEEHGAMLRFTGSVRALDPAARAALLDRSPRGKAPVRDRVAEILARVRAQGDIALVALARELDGVELASLEVPRDEWRLALDALSPDLRRALDRAARNIETAHRAFLPRAVEVETEEGVLVGRRPDPLARVGVYAPGGRAAYPSTVLMTAIPARVAGVSEIVLCSPPHASGRPSAMVLAAAECCGVDRVFALGGAGAIGAMAYGTRSVPRVDRIVGPGNAWVAEAKLQVAGAVGIDGPAGPSEILVLADASADPALVTRELLAQAEHDPDTWVIAVAIDPRIAEAIVESLARELPRQPRRKIVALALAARGGVLTADSLEEAIDLANAFAAEHLLLALADPEPALARVRNAGAVFVGSASSVAFGDYLTGANHTLPTGGSGCYGSGLSTLDFVRWTSTQRVTPAAAARLAGPTAALARWEGLPAHAAAAEAWAEAPTDSPRRSIEIARAAYREIPLYGGPPRTTCAIDLGDNTNRFGLPPAASRVLVELSPDAITRYPHPFADELKSALASYAGVGPDEIATGCGSDDVIDSAIRAFSEPGATLAYPDPTFAMVPLFARMNGLVPVPVPLGPDLDIDADAMLRTGAAVLYLCSPNNPTGIAARVDAIERVLREARGLVILDEAYAEFAGGPGWIARAPQYERLLVVRTLSKAFGLAGLRIGYGAGRPEIVREVEKSRGPFKVGGVAGRAARTALAEDLDWVRDGVAEVVACRARFSRALEGLGLRPVPSAANFVLLPVRDADATTAALRQAGVAVRPFPRLAGIGDAVRITIGPWEQMLAVLGALAEAPV